MKKLLLILFFPAILQINAQSTSDMSSQTYSQFEKADKNLNSAYKDLLVKYRDYPNFIKKLKIAQRLWIKYRDALIDVEFPSDEPRLDYGSIYPICVLGFKTKLTKKRTTELLNYMSYEEGDVCGGGPVD